MQMWNLSSTFLYVSCYFVTYEENMTRKRTENQCPFVSTKGTCDIQCDILHVMCEFAVRISRVTLFHTLLSASASDLEVITLHYNL